MNLDIQDIATSMIDAARAEVAGRWPQVKTLAEMELRRLAQSLAEVAQLLADGKIGEAHARQLVHMHQIAARAILLSVQGIALLTAEQAIRSAVGAAARTINGVAKVTLL